MADTPPGHKGDHPGNVDTIELPTLAPDPISPELFKPGSRKASSVAGSICSSSHDQSEVDAIMQGIRAAEASQRAAEAEAQVEELKLQLVKRKLLASSQGSNASGNSQRQNVNHADKYLRAYQSPDVANTMASDQPVDPNGPCAAEQAPLTTANLSKHAGFPCPKGPPSGETRGVRDKQPADQAVL